MSDFRDRPREAELFTRVCPNCGSTLVLETVFCDTKRPDRFACSDREHCASLYRVDYETAGWELRRL